MLQATSNSQPGCEKLLLSSDHIKRKLFLFNFIVLDYNECASTMDYCEENAKCQNVYRTYSCQCVPGFENASNTTGLLKCVGKLQLYTTCVSKNWRKISPATSKEEQQAKSMLFGLLCDSRLFIHAY